MRFFAHLIAAFLHDVDEIRQNTTQWLCHRSGPTGVGGSEPLGVEKVATAYKLQAVLFPLEWTSKFVDCLRFLVRDILFEDAELGSGGVCFFFFSGVFLDPCEAAVNKWDLFQSLSMILPSPQLNYAKNKR